MIVCARRMWWVCLLDQGFRCKVRPICRLHDRRLCAEYDRREALDPILDEDVYATAAARLSAGASGYVDADTALRHAVPDRIVGYGCEHMNITASGIVAGSVKAPCGCYMQPVYGD